jgi:NitT/TauT family transport system ATP-binding protein
MSGQQEPDDLAGTTGRAVVEERIRFEDVRLGFGRGRKRLEVLDGVSFDVRSGEFVSVLGPSGCGKSTLLNLAAGFLDADSGRVEVDREPVTGPDSRRGVVFQQYAIFPWLTVEKNIAFGLTLRSNKRSRAEIAETVARYVELMGLRGFEKAMPKTLSGGMRQRVALARAYATDPDVMLLDEPFAALDAQTREFMQELLHETSRQDRRAAMLITHSVEEAIFLSHRIVVLTNRPTHVHEVVDVDVEWPRTPQSRTAPAFIELRKHLEQVMRSMTTPARPPATPPESRNPS